MARLGMSEIISDLRVMCAIENSQDSLNNVDYWTDEQIQGYADERRSTLRRVLINPITTIASGNTPEYIYYSLPISRKFAIETSDTTEVSAFFIQDYIGQVWTPGGVGDDAYTVDYDERIIEFETSRTNKIYYLTCRVYPLNEIAAQIWLRKAALRFDLISLTIDNHRLDEDTEYKHCIEMYNYYSGLDGLKVSRMVRSDEIAYTIRR